MNSSTLSSEVIEEIKDVGLYIYPELVEKSVVDKLREQTLSILGDRGDTDYKFGTSINMGGLDEQYGPIREFFDTKYFNGLAHQYGKTEARA